MTATATRDDGGPYTLAIDVGGTGLKASVLDRAGHMVVDRVRIATPRRPRPAELVDLLVGLVKPLPAYDRISIGFPGVVRNGRVLTAPHFERDDDWRGFALQQAMAEQLGRPARLSNDAEIQGLGIIAGRGLEVVLTLGTGVGSAVFAGGRMTPHLELAHHPIRKNETYNEYLGVAAFKKVGVDKWNKRVRRMIDIVHTLLNYDTLYLGGGNAANVTLKLPPDVRIASNDKGIEGGVKLWDDAIWHAARDIGHGGGDGRPSGH